MLDPQPFLLLLGVLSILLALFVTAAGDDIYSALLWYQSPKVWIWVSAVRRHDVVTACDSASYSMTPIPLTPWMGCYYLQICFGVGVSGSIFCIIRSAPPFGMTRKGNRAPLHILCQSHPVLLFELYTMCFISFKGCKYLLRRAGTSTWSRVSSWLCGR